MRIGAAQLRALIAMSESPHGAAEVPWTSAAGLINRGLAHHVELFRQGAHPTCVITHAGRELVSELQRRAA